MIKVARLGGTELLINAELIETIEPTPDTVVSLTTGKKFVVSQSIDEVAELVLAYRQRANTPLNCQPCPDSGASV